jgi:DNA-binding NtrC family response regulator/predicted hydrocarbon binding protein
MADRTASRQSSTQSRPGGLAPDAAALPRYPGIGDLLEKIHFAPENGHIWLGEQRMVLLHASALGVLRSEVIESLGSERARGLLTRVGYNSGARDAELTRTLRTETSKVEAIYMGAQLHMLEGMTTVEPVRTEIDVEKGHFFGEFRWHGSVEDEEHLRLYGIGIEPACWMQTGYASGFASVFMGRPVLFRELECASQGAAYCRIVGRPVDEWDDAEDDLRLMRVNKLTSGLSTARTAAGPDNVASNLEPGARPLSDQDVVGASAGFNAVCQMLRRVADTPATVLLLGESGVGKEVLARALHRISTRAHGPFVALNCAAIPESLIEAELFGVEQGAFTGATSSRPGRFERAAQGTLFLDEIGILSWTAQGKLLRALQEREIERVGDTKTRKVNVRVVAASNLDLREEVRAGNFREDLFYRLNVFPIRVPPLRERREDIPIFMNHFLRKYNLLMGRAVAGFTTRAVDAMLNYEWPGNVRELENIMERGVILAPKDGVIDTVHLFIGGEQIKSSLLKIDGSGCLRTDAALAADDAVPNGFNQKIRQKIDSLLTGVKTDSNDVSLIDIEMLLLQSAVQQARGNLSAAARQLGISRAKLEYRLKSKAQGY